MVFVICLFESSFRMLVQRCSLYWITLEMCFVWFAVSLSFNYWWTLKNWETFKNFFFLVKIYWLCWVLIAACGILSCSIWDLVPWPGIQPRLPALGHGVLASGPPGKSQIGKFLSEIHGFLYFGRKAWKSC